MRKGKPHPLRLDEDLEKMIQILCATSGEGKSEIMRRLLRKAAQEEITKEVADYVTPQIRKAIRESLIPFEERIAKINAKTSIAAGTTMYTNIEVLGQMGHDVRRIHEMARKKAVAFLKMPMETVVEDGDE